MNWKFTHIHHAFRRQAGITLNEYAVLDIIYKTQTHPSTKIDDGWAACTYSQMADFLGLSKGAIHKIVERMESIELLEVNSAHPSQKRTTPLWFENAYLDDEESVEIAAEMVKVQKVNEDEKVQKVNICVQKVNDKSSKSEHLRSKSERHINKRKESLNKEKINNTPKGDFFENQITSILEKLNDLSGRNLPTIGKRSESSRSKVRNLLKKEYTEAEISDVVQLKCFEWGRNPEMFQYLHPTTLFRPLNFQKYLDCLNDLKNNPDKAEQFKKKINGVNNRNTAPTIITESTKRDALRELFEEGYFNNGYEH